MQENPSLELLERLLSEVMLNVHGEIEEQDYQALFQVQYHLIQVSKNGYLDIDEADLIQNEIAEAKERRFSRGTGTISLNQFRKRKEEGED